MTAIPTPRKRRKRDERQTTPSPMKLTTRDKEVVRAVHEYRVLRQDQIEALLFPHKASAQRRLVKLYDYGFLERHFLPTRGGLMNSPILYSLDKRGIELLRAEFGYEDLNWYPSSKALKDDFLEHTMAINEVRVVVTLACRRLGYQLLTWKGEGELKADYDRVAIPVKGARREVSLIPDSYFVLDTPHGQAHFFLELDRGTMTTARFQTKIAAYISYQRSGAYERRYNTRSLRVLTVTLGPQRLANLKHLTEATGGQQWFWFAVLSDLNAEHVLSAPVWQLASWKGQAALIEPQKR
jgi:hypothetical protein